MLTKMEYEILEEEAGRRPARPWGAAVGACLEFLAGSGHLSSGSLTSKGWLAISTPWASDETLPPDAAVLNLRAPLATADGRAVRLFETDRKGGPPLVGTIQREDGFEIVSCWHADGRHSWSVAEPFESGVYDIVAALPTGGAALQLSDRTRDLRNAPADAATEEVSDPQGDLGLFRGFEDPQRFMRECGAGAVAESVHELEAM